MRTTESSTTPRRGPCTNDADGVGGEGLGVGDLDGDGLITATECAYLLTGDRAYLDFYRSQVDYLLDRAIERDGDLLVPYKAKDFDKIGKAFKDPAGYWTAIDMYVAAFCVNKDRIAKRNIPVPASWADLTKPAYKGEIIMPNPASSGTGYLQVTSLLFMNGIKQGKQGGWDFLTKLHENIVEYTNSGSAPAKLASSGEVAVGVSFSYRVAKQIADGFPVTMVFPSEGSGYELEANALVKGAKHPEGAKRFLDWALTENAMKNRPEIMMIKLKKEAAADCILGYTCFNDVTARDLQIKDVQFTRSKSFDTFAPMGPWIVTDIDPGSLDIETYVNGERKQCSNTRQLVFDPFHLVHFVSWVMTLYPGDVIASGTPAGIGPLKGGDRVEIRIRGIGSLINEVASWE